MEFPNPLSRKKDLIRLLGVMKLRLSYKNGLKGTVLTLISMHETIKKFPQAPYNLLKCLAGWGLPWGSSDIWLKRVVSHKRVRFSGLVSKLEYKFFQSVFWTGDGLKVGGPWSGFIVLTINCYCFKIQF